MNNKIKLYVSKEENISEDLLYADNSTLISYFITAEDCSVETENCELKLLEDLLKEKYQAIRKQVCDEIRNLAHNYFGLIICDNCGNPIDDDCYISSSELCEILEKVEKGDI